MPYRSQKTVLLLSVLLLVASACAGKSASGTPGTGSGKTPLVIYAAGSLILPFGDLVKAFEDKYPSIDVQAQYHGSIQVIRQVTELHLPIDVVATADTALIPSMMYSTKDTATGQPYASWYIHFGSNTLAVAYKPSSKYSNEITADNWYSILARPDVRVGIADPRFDAAGYRALMTFALAQPYYHDTTIFTKMFSGNFTFPLDIFNDPRQTTITVPEIVETVNGSHILVRGASIQTIALLESGDIDYAFDYESVIRQHNLSLLHLPDAINLGSDVYNQNYATVQVDLNAQRFATVKPQFQGARIDYGITIPSNAPHPVEAALFIAFLLGPEGRAIMKQDYQPMFDPAPGDHFDNIPSALQVLCTAAVTP
jgi:molybdate/tungstate transport system substrate-binding protein